MYHKRKLHMGVAALVAITACSDRMDAPVGPDRGSLQPKSPTAVLPASGERVTVTRTTSVRSGAPARDGNPSSFVRRKQSFTVGAGQVTMRPEDVAMRAALNPKLREAPTSIDDRPLLGLTRPARTTSFRAAVVPWHTTVAIPGEYGLIVESRGVGSEPASEMRYIRNGAPEMTVTQSWEFWQGQWNLVRREAVMADSSASELVEVSRTGRNGTAAQSAASWASSVGTGAAARPSFDVFDADTVCARCAKEVIAENAAWLKWAAKDFAAVTACALIPPPATIAACVTALLATLDAALDWNKASEELALCQRTAPPCPPPPPPNPPTPDDGGLPNDGGSVGSTGGTGGPGSTAGHNECTYYYEYDLNTGDVTFSQLLYCVWVPGV